MLRTTLIFGLAAGFLLACLEWIIYPLCYRGYITLDNSSYIGFAGMLIAFSMIYFGIRSYRDTQGGVTFWKAVQIGLLITLIGALLHAAGWHIYNFINPDFKDFFIQKFTEYKTSSMTAATDQAAIDAVKHEIEIMRTIYENPLVDLVFSMLMIAPAGIVITLISAFLLRSKTSAPGTGGRSNKKD